MRRYGPSLINKGAKSSRPKQTIEYEEKNGEDKFIDKKEPSHWKTIFENIKRMRLQRDAPVDEMGAEKCANKEESPMVFRFQTLISLMLSSQTKDRITHGAMVKLCDYGLTVERMMGISEKSLQELIYPVCFYRRKSEYIKLTSQILHEKYHSDIPGTVEELCNLPGVGKKMAYLCLDIAWNKLEGIGVDTHVHRISNRLGWTIKATKTPEATRKSLEEWLPKEYWREMNILLVGFGQQICLPVSPKCNECLNKDICPYGSSPVRAVKKRPLN